MGQPFEPNAGQQRPAHALTLQAAQFVFVGAAAAGVHFLSLMAWVQWAHVPPAYANILAFLVAFCVSFTGHYRLTFRAQNRHGFRASLWRWFATSVGGFLLNQAVFVAGIYLFGNGAYRWVWFAATLIAMLLTFALGKFWAFGRKNNPKIKGKP